VTGGAVTDAEASIAVALEPDDSARARRAWPLVWMLMVVFAVNVVDRQMMTVLGNEISRDLGLTDAQLGLLGGLGFSAVYFVFSLPWGWVADRPRFSRLWVISSALTIWSTMTAVCGLAQTFGQLLLARTGVAAGEAGCTSPATALISEAVPRAKLARALAVFGLGVPIGGLVGRILGGTLADAVGWRAACFLVGAPGVLLAVALVLAFKDLRPRRPPPDARRRVPTLRRAFAEILRSKTILYIALANILMAAFTAGFGFWGMMHFQRNLGLSPGEAGVWLGLQGGFSGIVGTLIGGWVADRLARQRPRHYTTPAVVGMLMAPPLLLLAWSSDVWWLALLFLLLPSMGDNLCFGGTSAATQRLLSSDVRATVSSILAMTIMLLGPGLGITLLGLASDLVRDQLPATASPHASVRYVLLGSAAGFVLPALFYWLAGRHVEHELGRFEQREG
jgi:predicted MFS family arabinose efflux permease